MEKFAVDLDKVLDEFEFNEDRAEQTATLVAKKSNVSVPPVVGGSFLCRPTSYYCRPEFESINLVDADFAAEPQTFSLQYNNGFSSSTNFSTRQSADDGNHHLCSSENLNKSKELRIRNDASKDSQLLDLDRYQNKMSAFHNYSKIEVNSTAQKTYSTTENEMRGHRNMPYHPQTTDFRQQDTAHDKSETTSKLNVSGVFSSLHEYLNAGNVDANVGDVGIVSNQNTWNSAKQLMIETEHNGNCTLSHIEESLVDSEGQYEQSHSAETFCSVNANEKVQGQTSQDTLKNNIGNFGNCLVLNNGQWSGTFDAHKVQSYADLIPNSGQSSSGTLFKSDETPDLLDNGNHLSTQIQSDNSIAKFPDRVTRESSQDKSQSKLSSLPDVANSGTNTLNISGVASDLITSHGDRILSNESIEYCDRKQQSCSGNISNLTTQVMESDVNRSFSRSDIVHVFPTEGNKSHCTTMIGTVGDNDSNFSLLKPKHTFSFGENLTGQNENASLPNLVDAEANRSIKNIFLGNTSLATDKENHFEEKLEPEQRSPVPIGFNAVEAWSDAELHQYLQELESDCVTETYAEDEGKIIKNSEVDNNDKDSVRHSEIESEEHTENIECSRSSVENGKLAENDITNGSMCISDETKSALSSESSHRDTLYDTLSTESSVGISGLPSFVQDSLDENKHEMSTALSFMTLTKPKSISLNAAICSTSQVEDVIKPELINTETNKVEAFPPPVSTVPVAALKTSSSVITKLVSIDCQQINKSVSETENHVVPESDNNETSDIGLLNVKNETEEIKDQCVSQNGTPDVIESELKSAESPQSVPDAENGMDDVNTPDAVRALNETISVGLDKLPHEESLPDSEDSISQPSTADDTPEKESGQETCSLRNYVPFDNSGPTTESVPETIISEVQSCLVRMPRDGTTINVLGEEERPSRPKYLFLPSKITMENEQEESENSEESPPMSGAVGPPGETPVAEARTNSLESGENVPLSSPDVSESSSIEQAMSPVTSLHIATPLSDDLSETLSPEERSLGKLPPFWVPDADAPNCMQCDVKFTVLKRRHHCRACGKVLCSKCCSLKSRLEYMDNAEARVCQPCFTTLAKVFLVEQGESASGSPSSLNEGASNAPLGRQPNPNNPMEYCSTIPPLEQAANVLRQPPPSVLVPVGVLKREGSTRSRSDVAKQVIFSDGIRPGGDLTELDGSSEPRLPYRRPGRVLKRVGTPPGPPAPNHSIQRSLPPLDPKTLSYIPNDKGGLPPLAVFTKGEVKFEDVVDHDKQMASLRSETELPTLFAINRNLFVQVKILNLDCCVNRTCWCFSTSGMSCVGQDEIVIILECLPDETTVPKDIFRHLNSVFQEASRGNTLSELGHTIFKGLPFLGSVDHGGFIYIRPSFQCLQKLILPSSPYLVAILVHRWETPWATVFPIRLMLRLGAEYRYYPCMLVSVRNRRPVYWEIGHTIINLLADFRNLSYTLPSVRGMVIHMEDRQTSILLPRNRYDQVTRALNNSNDHVLALAANFSFTADSHLVCIQSSRDESYHTQAINIHNKPRKVTGASFVVFNGALKTSSNLTAKSSIVEDGLMVQITPDTMQALRGALRNMQDFSVGCGPAGASQPDEIVNLKWVQDDKNFNVGVKSSIDGRSLDGIPSIRVHNGTDYMGSCRLIRWTEVFILQSDEGSARSGDPLDISRLSESLARATCLALIKLLDLLAQAGLTKLAVRATVHPENVGYEAGSKGEKLPPIYMDSLDNELVPVLHKAASMSQDSSTAILELIFHVMLQ